MTAELQPRRCRTCENEIPADSADGLCPACLLMLGADDEDESVVGQTVSHYRVVERIASGGMGIVYRAEDARLERPVAIKFIRSAIIDEPDARGRFKREAQAVATLHHPNICGFFDFGEHRGRPYIVTELLEGETLAERLSRGPIPIDQALEIATQVAEGLKTAHSKSLVHRDIKPGNIFLTDEGEVKLLDFGLAKPVRHVPALGASIPTISASAAFVGTIPYMSPEQLQAKPVDSRTDWFSFGIVLYEMVSGTRPFDGGSAAETIAAIQREPHQSLTRRHPHVPRALSTMVDKLLSKDRDRRHRDGNEVLSDLGKARSERPRSLQWRRLAPAVAVAALLVGLIVLLLAWPDPGVTVNEQAFQDFGLGQAALDRRTVEGFETAIDYFRRAIEEAPDYAEAYAGLARAYAVWGTAGYSTERPIEMMNEARIAAERSLELDPDLAEAHAALGQFEMNFDRDWNAAEGHFIAAIDLDPGYAEAHHWYALYLAATGDLDGALDQATEAQRLDPGSTVISALMGRIRYYRGEYQEAEAQYGRALSVEAESVPARLGLLLLHLGQANFAAAYEEIRQNPAMPQPLRDAFIGAFDLARAGEFTEAEARLRPFADMEGGDVMPLYLAVFSAVFEQEEETLFWLGRTVEERLDYAVYMNVDPLFAFVRDDPEYPRLLAEIGLS